MKIKKVKKIILAILTILLLFSFVGCNWMQEIYLDFENIRYEIEDFKITKLPEKLIYEAGIDTALDLSGGEIEVVTRNGKKSTIDMSWFDDSSSDSNPFRMSSNIDFNRSGTYYVELEIKDKAERFTVNVV